MPSVPPPLRAAEREPLAPEVLESIDALALYWSKTVVREATIRENLISLCREVAAGYAKPSLPPDGEPDAQEIERVARHPLVVDAIEEVEANGGVNAARYDLVATILRATRPPEGRPNAE